MGIEAYFPYTTMEDLVNWQLEGTGFTRTDFEAKGFVAYAKQPIFWDRLDGLKIKTPSGKIELRSTLLEEAGYPSFPPYEAVTRPEGDQFRLVVGRVAAHTHVSTQNNPYLSELFPENTLWINKQRAAALGIADGQEVQVQSSRGSGDQGVCHRFDSPGGGLHGARFRPRGQERHAQLQQGRFRQRFAGEPHRPRRRQSGPARYLRHGQSAVNPKSRPIDGSGGMNGSDSALAGCNTNRDQYAWRGPQSRRLL
jgi:anaerobic selenocysteine-containing dehydrogenase